MTELPLLVNIALALGYALAGGLLARRVGLPTIVGYLVAGVALGPFTPGFHGDPEAIHQMAEFGVILLMFGVGLHFSFRDLWQVRRVVIPGAVVQMAVIAGAGYLLGRYWGFTSVASWIIGLAAAVTSTVVQMRSLMDNGWLESPSGKVAIGWLIVEDLLVVAILVLLPVLAGPTTSAPWLTGIMAVGKALLFVALMVFAGSRLVPFILGRVVHTRSRELFVLVALTMAVGTALGSAALFGVSLALGAFVAGIVVGESPFSHQIGADLLPFREAFAVVFFVSVGMLVNPKYVLEHWNQLLLISTIIILGKAVVSGVLTNLLGCSGRTTLIVATGRSQIGEFSFILGQSGVAMGVIDDGQYSLILAGAIVSITLNPLLVGLVDPLERWLKKRPALWNIVDRPVQDLPPEPESLSDHVVIVGCGRVGRHIAETLGRLNIPRVVIEADPIRVNKLRELGVPVLYGEAGNSEILEHVALKRARTLIITLPDDAAALSVVLTARKTAPDVHIICRASTWDGARRLKADGAGEVVRPELEGGVEIVRRTLLELHLPVREIQRYTDFVRREGLDEELDKVSLNRARVLDDLVKTAGDLELGWMSVADNSPLSGLRIVDASLRQNAGVSVVAISRERAVISNPGPEVIFVPGDRVAVIGTPEQVSAAEKLFTP